MVNFFGYHFKRLDFVLALTDILICATGFFLYAWLGLASSGSTTPTFISPIFLSIFTGLILWGLLFAVGINSVPQVGKIQSFLLRATLVFFISTPLIIFLWYVSGFQYETMPLFTVPAIFIQISILCLVRITILKLVPNHFITENIIMFTTTEEKSLIKKMINNFNQYKIKRYFNLDLITLKPQFNLTQFCMKHNITKVVLGNLKDKRNLKQFIDLAYAGIEVIYIDSFKEQHIGKININHYYNYTSFINKQFNYPIITLWLKRLFDIIVSLILLILCLPLIIIIAVLIKYYDGGPILYKQKRTGINNKVFTIYKFRSMYENAEKDGIKWASKNDDRVTPIGRFMRTKRLDELPQLINILKNDMSLVGPRPERPEIIPSLQTHIPCYNERHRIKPGLTGWAQINVGYGDTLEATQEKLEYDLYYLKYYNLSLDALIILKTISVVLWPANVH